MSVVCCPVLVCCAICGGFCDGSAAAFAVVEESILSLLTNVKEKRGSGDIEGNINSSFSLDLEPADWA